MKPLYICLECGHPFYSVSSAKYAMEEGCPNCGGFDIDLYVENEEVR